MISLSLYTHTNTRLHIYMGLHSSNHLYCVCFTDGIIMQSYCLYGNADFLYMFSVQKAVMKINESSTCPYLMHMAYWCIFTGYDMYIVTITVYCCMGRLATMPDGVCQSHTRLKGQLGLCV